VARQVKENVDPISENRIRQLLVARATYRTPGRRRGLKTLRQVILDDAIRVTNRHEFVAAEVLQTSHQKISHRMPTEIR
jgi:hypothetical protein